MDRMDLSSIYKINRNNIKDTSPQRENHSIWTPFHKLRMVRLGTVVSHRQKLGLNTDTSPTLENNESEVFINEAKFK